MGDLGEIIGHFVAASRESLGQVEQDLAALEHEPHAPEPIARILRAIHPIKGTSGFLAFPGLESLSQAAESLVTRLADGGQVTPAAVAALRAAAAGMRDLLTGIERAGGEPELDTTATVAQLRAAALDEHGRIPTERTAAGPGAPPDHADARDRVDTPDPLETPDGAASPAGAATPEAADAAGTPDAVDPADGTGAAEGPDAGRSAVPEQPSRRLPEPVEQQRRPLGEMLVEQGAASSADVTWALQRQLAGDQRRLGTILLDEGKAAAAAVTEALAAQASRRPTRDSAVRVDAELLDDLLHLVGELVLARNQMVHGVLESGDPALVRGAARLGVIAAELQERIMRTRMQPIEQVCAKLPRLVRDLAGSLDKQVRLVVQGRETELDRTLLAAVKEPLLQLVRNAVQHGVENPQTRTDAGKDPQGTVTIRATQAAGHVVIEVVDDGAGLDVGTIGQAAAEAGLVRPEQLAGMERRDVVALLLRPGFPIASGLDAVKTNVERIGGTVQVESPAGEGTRWRLTIPLNRTIVQALTVDCADQRYVLPQAAVTDLVYLDGIATRIEYAAGTPVYRLRGSELPVVRLDRALGADVGPDSGVYLVVLQAENRSFGLVVDRVLNTEEVVVKALTTPFTETGPYAGATILGDGKVALVLDAAALLRDWEESADRWTDRSAPASPTPAGPGERMLVAVVGRRRVAIPLDSEARLEQVPRDRLGYAEGREIIRQHGRTVPLTRLSSVLGVPAEDPGDPAPVVFYREPGRTVALLVDRVVETAEEVPAGQPATPDATLVGTGILQQRITELLDARRAILAADPNFSGQPGQMLVGT